MKRIVKPEFAAAATVLLGIAGFFLYERLYATGLDVKNLLMAGHPMETALWLVTALAAAAAVVTGWSVSGSNRYEEHFGASLAAALGNIFLAAGILLTVLPQPAVTAGLVGKLWKYLGIVSAPLLLCAAFSRAQGMKPFFATHAVPCLFFMLHLVCHYRLWCSNPQLQDYIFAFLATLGLMLLAYCHGAFEAEMGNCRMTLAAGLLTGYLCLVTLGNTPYVPLYLTGAFWAVTGLCKTGAASADEPKAGDNDASS